MSRINDVLRLSDAQAGVLLGVTVAATPVLAKAECARDEKAVAASRLLVDVGALELVEDEAYITDAGTGLLKDMALVDETGNVTPDGEQILQAHNAESDTMGAPPEEPEGDQSQPMESATRWDMIDRMNDITTSIEALTEDVTVELIGTLFDNR